MVEIILLQPMQELLDLDQRIFSLNQLDFNL